MNPIEIAHETLILLEHIDSEGSISVQITRLTR